MKKTVVFTLIAALLLSLGWGGIGAKNIAAQEAADPKIEFSEILDLSVSGVNAGENSGHGNHQTRVVHTSHGSYAAYITDSIKADDNRQMDQFSVIKIKEDGSVQVVLQEYKCYDTSQVSLLVDNDENVWAITVNDNKLKDGLDGRDPNLITAAYRIDAKTDKTEGYTANFSIKEDNGLGYSSTCYDAVNNKIYTFTNAGYYPVAHIFWAIFDVETGTWEETIRSMKLDTRHGYIYAQADGKGGVFLTGNRDNRCTDLGYPEIGSNYGLSEEDMAELEATEGERWSANYCWDQVDLFYIPDVYSEEFEELVVAEADYSRASGSQEYRYSKEGRRNSYYPNVTNNTSGGETYLDGNGYLHIIYQEIFMQAAWNRGKISDSTWYHKVFDISDPSNMKELSKTPIIEEVAANAANSYRITEDENGNLYLLSGEQKRVNSDGSSELIVYAAEGTPAGGYTYRKLASAPYTGSKVINISNSRSNSVADGKIDVIFQDSRGNTYQYMQIELKAPSISVDGNEVTIKGIKVEMKDQNGKVLAIGENELEIKAVDKAGKEYSGQVAADGTVTFAPFEITEAGEYTLTFTMVKGSDKSIAYSTDTFVMTIKAVEKDGALAFEVAGITKNGEEAEEIVFNVVKTVGTDPSTGDNSQVWVWFALVAAALVAAAAMVGLRKKTVVQK